MTRSLIMRSTRIILVGLIVVVGFGADSLLGQEDRGMALLDEAAQRYAGVDRLCADFSQSLSVPLLGQERSGKGRLCQRSPNLFAMRFQDPAGDAVVVDGTSVWLYYPSTDPKQVLKLPMQDLPGGFDFHRAFLHEPASKYRVSYEGEDTLGGRTVHRLALQPKDPAAYQRAVLWIDAGTPVLRQIRVTEENGSIRTVSLDSVEFGADAPTGWFEFTPPPGAQVIAR